MIAVPDKVDLKRIDDYDTSAQLTILRDICNSIYIARNITMSEELIIDNLEKIDKLLRDENYN